MTLHVAYLPSVVEANFESVRLAAANQGIVLDPDLPFLIYADVMGQLGLQAIDLRPTLSKVRAEGHMLNVMADFHYSAALSKAVGASLWDGLDIANRSVEKAAER